MMNLIFLPPLLLFAGRVVSSPRRGEHASGRTGPLRRPGRGPRRECARPGPWRWSAGKNASGRGRARRPGCALPGPGGGGGSPARSGPRSPAAAARRPQRGAHPVPAPPGIRQGRVQNQNVRLQPGGDAPPLRPHVRTAALRAVDGFDHRRISRLQPRPVLWAAKVPAGTPVRIEVSLRRASLRRCLASFCSAAEARIRPHGLCVMKKSPASILHGGL